ncbi:hypothetical protein ACJX0J_018704, partial [Zea mays]
RRLRHQVTLSNWSLEGQMLGRRRRRHPSLEAFAAAAELTQTKQAGTPFACTAPDEDRRRRASHCAASSSSEAHIDGKAALLGFVRAPWTIATYIVEGGMTNTYTNIKNMCHTAPDVLRCLLSHLAECIQIFDSWGGQLPPHVWEQWSKPYIKKIVNRIKKECPHVPLMLYINGNGGLLERMKDTRVDVIGLDWTVDMADGRKRLGNGISVQGNVDPAFLFSPLPVLTDEIR